MSDNTASADDRTAAYSDAGQHDSTCPNPCMILDDNRAADVCLLAADGKAGVKQHTSGGERHVIPYNYLHLAKYFNAIIYGASLTDLDIIKIANKKPAINIYPAAEYK